MNSQNHCFETAFKLVQGYLIKAGAG